MKRGFLTIDIGALPDGSAPTEETDFTEQINGLIHDFCQRFPGAECYCYATIAGRFQLILPAKSGNIALQPEQRAWFESHDELSIMIQGALIEWSRPESLAKERLGSAYESKRMSQIYLLIRDDHTGSLLDYRAIYRS
jgi:hypothetical protein